MTLFYTPAEHTVEIIYNKECERMKSVEMRSDYLRPVLVVQIRLTGAYQELHYYAA